MIVIGLTGSIGMGKSTVARMFGMMGGGIHDSDACVKKALNPYGKAFEAVALTFPMAWDKKKYVLKKDVLSDLIFYNKKARQKLENILHPIVQADQKKFLLQQRQLGRKFCVLDIPLLFETNADKRVDYTVVVDAPYFIQAQRVLRRPKMTPEKFEQILLTQMPNDEKCALANFVIQTGLGKAYSMKQVKLILKELT